MFKVIRKHRRKDINQPWLGGKPSKEYNYVFNEKYVKTAKFLKMYNNVSTDGLCNDIISEWATEEDYIDFITDDDPIISSWQAAQLIYVEENNFINVISYKEETYPTFYDQAHIFVVFRPGEAGNFVSGVINSLLDKKLSELAFSKSGHAHFNSIVERKKLGIDHLSLGMGISGLEQVFDTEEEKIEYYKDKINSTNYENKRYVTWTHDFKNIPLYKSLFPNSKILVITSDTFRERLISLIMALKKNHFSEDNQLPLTPDDRIKPRILKRNIIKKFFAKNYNKIYQAGSNELDLFLLLQAFMSAHKLDLDARLDSKISYTDDGTDTSLSYIEKQIQHSISHEHSVLADALIEFNDILNGNTQKLSTVIELIIGTQLSSDEISYVSDSLDNYIRNQDASIINSPVSYIKSLKEKADTIVSAFKDK
jgi:hypothetical protein